MQIIVEKVSNLAVLMFEDGVAVKLLANRLDAPGLMVADVNATTHKIVVGNGPPSPLMWVARALSFNGTWSVADQSLYDACVPNAQAQLTALAMQYSKALEVNKAGFALRVDADVDAIYRAAVGERGPEYDKANRQAIAYKTAGYVGPVPKSVAGWAAAKGWTSTQAADDILLAAAKLEGAQDAIRDARLLRKEQARAATTEAALATVVGQWEQFVTTVRSQLGI